MGASSGVARVCADALGVVDHGGEDEHTQSEEDDEEQEFIGAGTERVTQHSQPHEMTRELEDSQDSDESHHAQKAQHVFSRFRGEAAQRHLQVKGQDGYKVDDVQRALEELDLVRTEDDTGEHLDGEPDDAYALHVGQPSVSHYLKHNLLPRDVPHRHVLCLIVDGVEGLMCLQAKC